MRTQNRRTIRRGFTLLEMLVVVAVISILLSLLGGVGIAVMRHQKVSQTQNILATLDRAFDEYLTLVRAVPPYIPSDYFKVPGHANDESDNTLFPNYLGVQDNPKRPDAAVFLKQAMGVGEVGAIIRGLPTQFLRVTRGGEGGNEATGDQDLTPSIVDSWGSAGWPQGESDHLWDLDRQQVIYFVHPDNRLAQDLYGQCVNRRPYFFSAGPDLKYGLTSELPTGSPAEEVYEVMADNIYSYPVGDINRETAFFNMYR